MKAFLKNWLEPIGLFLFMIVMVGALLFAQTHRAPSKKNKPAPVDSTKQVSRTAIIEEAATIITSN